MSFRTLFYCRTWERYPNRFHWGVTFGTPSEGAPALNNQLVLTRYSITVNVHNTLEIVCTVIYYVTESLPIWRLRLWVSPFNGGNSCFSSGSYSGYKSKIFQKVWLIEQLDFPPKGSTNIILLDLWNVDWNSMVDQLCLDITYQHSTCCADADQHGQSQPKGVPGQTFSNTNLHARDALQTFF